MFHLNLTKEDSRRSKSGVRSKNTTAQQFCSVVFLVRLGPLPGSFAIWQETNGQKSAKNIIKNAPLCADACNTPAYSLIFLDVFCLSFVFSQRALRSKKFNPDRKFHSRLEMFNLDRNSQSRAKISNLRCLYSRGPPGVTENGAIEYFNPRSIARNFQSRRPQSNFFNPRAL